MGWRDDVKKRDGTEKWLELVETLRSVTEGKVRVPIFYIFDPHLSGMLVDLPGNASRSGYIITGDLSRGSRSYCYNSCCRKGITSDSIRSSLGFTSRDIFLNGEERENRVHT